MHPHTRLDVVVAMAVGRDLQAQALVAHRVVVADDAVVLPAEDIRQIAGEGDEGRAGVFGRPGEAAVVGRVSRASQE